MTSLSPIPPIDECVAEDVRDRVMSLRRRRDAALVVLSPMEPALAAAVAGALARTGVECDVVRLPDAGEFPDIDWLRSDLNRGV